MIKTVTITHHTAIRKYNWEIVIPEAPIVLVPDANFHRALELLEMETDQAICAEILALPNGGSRSVNADMTPERTKGLEALGV